MATPSGGTLQKADPKTIQDKFLVAYQGWFTCRGDGPPVHSGHHGWLHWFDKPIVEGGRPNMDLWPDVSTYSPSELFPAPGLSLPSGQPACLFSSRHPRTVQRHFHWMAEHGVDGCFLQRFASHIEADGDQRSAKADLMRLRDEIGGRVRVAAEQEGRVFAIMYDISGVPTHQLQKILEVDWNHLIRDLALLDSPNYLREKGKPVVAIWGMGFSSNHHDPAVLTQIVRNMRAMTPGGAYIMAGTPTHWQTLTGDADSNPAFLDLYYNELDAISPWTVGRYRDLNGADRFAAHKFKHDMQAIEKNSRGRKIDYIPVVWPGGSEHNLSNKQRQPNFAPRDGGGKFLWRQIFNAKHYGARIIYGATWDEYDEGTALMPAEPYKRNLPQGGRFIALDEDGYDLPPDWYMRICGMAAEGLRDERRIYDTFPKKELDDYWSSRPKYDKASVEASSSGSASGPGSGFQEWLTAEKEKEKEEAPPPPYTLESDEPTTTSQSAPIPSRGSSSEASTQPAAATIPMSPSTAPIPQRGSSTGTIEPNVQAQASGQGHSVLPGSFVGGFNEAPGRYVGSPRPTGEASSSLVDEFNRHTLSDHAEPHRVTSPYSPSPPIPMHSRPSLHSFHSSGSSTNSWSQAQFPPAEWNLPKPQETSPQPTYHSYSSSYPHRAPSSPSSGQSPGTLPEGPSWPAAYAQPQVNNQSYRPSYTHPEQSSHRPFHQGSFPPPGQSYPPVHQGSFPPPGQSFPPVHQGSSPPPRQSFPPFHPGSSSPSGQSFPPLHQQTSSQQQEQPFRPYHQETSSQQHGQPFPPYGPGVSTQQGQFPSPQTHPQQSPYLRPPPSIPPRPATSGSSSIPWGVVDKLAGKQTRKKLEQGVDSVVQTSTKLLNQYKR